MGWEGRDCGDQRLKRRGLEDVDVGESGMGELLGFCEGDGWI